MKKLQLSFVFLFLSLAFYAQKEEILLTVNDEIVTVSEFKNVYEKNIDLIDDDAKNIDENLELYINYKLKVQEAYAIKLDTFKSYKRELKKYKAQLIAPYLQDEDYKKKQVIEAYNRTKEEVRASHLLILFPKKGKIDTLAMLTKLNNARKRILNGESFAKVAKEVSEDPSVHQNAGDLGYFSAFKMVYPFEEAAYTTELGEVSQPFKTRFGYHIIKLTDKRLSKGKFEVAHILIKGTTNGAKDKISNAYKKIEKGASFESIAKEISDDKGSASNGGRLNKFSTGTMVAPFENAVLSLKEIGNYSKPFKTKYGWHIVKLLKKHPIGTFEDMEVSLTKKIMSSSRGNLSKKAVINRLKKEYKIVTDENVLNSIFDSQKTSDSNNILATINEKNIFVKDFKNYTKNKRKKESKKVYDDFLNNEILNYFKNEIENTNTNFKNTFSEYKDGLLLFDLMQNKIWGKASKDSVGLQEYFDNNKEIYKETSLEKNKGKVINDYQKQLEDTWLKNLRKNSVIKIRKRALKKFKNNYNQK